MPNISDTVYSAFVKNVYTDKNTVNTDDYVFCREPSYRSQAQLKNEQSILQLFFDSYSLAYALPLMLNTTAGEPFFDHDGALWTARKRIPGERFDWRHMSWSLAHSKASAEALAQLHSVSLVPGIQQELQADLAASELDYPALLIQKTKDLKSAAQKWLKGDPETLLNRLAVLLGNESFSDTVKSNFCFIHGDFHPGNVIYQSQSAKQEVVVTAVIDWDYSRWGSQLMDFCLARLMFAGSFRAQGTQIHDTVREQDTLLDDHARAFTLGYKRTLARVLKDSVLYPEGIVSWDEQSLPQNQAALSQVNEGSLRPYHLMAMLLIAFFELECLEAQHNNPDQIILANLQTLFEQISRVCATF